jgi:parallel beta-helix repeat protein
MISPVSIYMQIKQKIGLLYIDGDNSVKRVFADFNTYYNDVRVGGYIILHKIYSETSGSRVLLEHLKAYRAIPNHVELIEMPTGDFGIAVLHKKTDKALHIMLPEPNRFKRIQHKLLGKTPWFPVKIVPTSKYQLQINLIDIDTKNPITGARVICPQLWEKFRITDANGSIVFDYYLSNRYIFEISAPNYFTPDDVFIDISAKKLLHQSTIVLKKKPSEVIIAISDAESGKPIPAAIIDCQSEWNDSKITDQNGILRLETYLDKQYVFNISADGYLSKDNVTINVLADLMVQNFTISLNILPTLMIKVVDNLLNKPISNAKFSCSQLSPLITDQDGNISLEHCLPDQYIFDIVANGYHSQQQIPIEIKATPALQTFTIELEMQWALFERMNLINKIEIPPRFSKATNSYKSVISAEDFTVKRLFEEIAALANTGGEIHLPEGQLELTETLKLPSNLRLIGVAGKTELIFKDVDFGLMIQNHNGIEVENLRIRHQGTHKFCAAVLITQATDLSFSNVEIIKPRAVGFLFADNVHRTRLEHCSVYEANLVGFMMVRNVWNTILQSCVAEGCKQGGVFLTDLKLPSHIDSLDFHNQIHHTSEIIGNFAPFDPQDPLPYRNSLIDCTFRYNRKMGITTDGVGYLNVINCVIANNDCEGITIDNGSWGCQILNCHIYNNGWRGLQDETELNQDFVEQMGIMEDGSSKAKLPGISLDNAAYCRIENNSIEDNWGDGVKFVRSVYACTVANNLITHNNKGINDKFHFFGVLIGVAQRQHSEQSDFPSCHNSIINNDIIGKHYAGIHLLAGTSHNLVKDNRIIDATFVDIEDHTN